MSTLICSFDGLHDNRVLRYCADFEAHTLHIDTRTEAGEKVSVRFTGLLAHWFENVVQDNILFGMDEISVDAFFEQYKDLLGGTISYGFPACCSMVNKHKRPIRQSKRNSTTMAAMGVTAVAARSGSLWASRSSVSPALSSMSLRSRPDWFPVKKAQGELQHMGHGGPPDVPGGAEGGDMGGHEGGEVQQDTANGSPHRHPAKTAQVPGPVQTGPGGQHALGHQPDTQIRRQPQHRRQGGQDTAQDRQVFVPARIA